MPNTKLVFEYLINQNMEPLDFKLCMLIHHTESDNDGYVYIDEAEWSKKVKKSLRTIQRSFNTLSTQGVILKDYTPRPNCPKKKGTPLYVKLLLPKHLTQKLTPPEPYIPTCEIESITLNLAQSAALKGVLLTKRSLYQILTIYKGYNVDEAHKAVERLITVGELEFSSESDTLAPKITGVILQLKTNKIIKVLEEKFFTKDKSKKSFFELVEFCFGKNKDLDAKGKVGKVINYSIPHSQDKDSQERVKKNYRPLEEIIKRVVDNAHYHGCVLTHAAIQEYCFIYRSIPKEKTDRVLKA